MEILLIVGCLLLIFCLIMMIENARQSICYYILSRTFRSPFFVDNPNLTRDLYDYNIWWIYRFYRSFKQGMRHSILDKSDPTYYCRHVSIFKVEGRSHLKMEKFCEVAYHWGLSCGKEHTQ